MFLDPNQTSSCKVKSLVQSFENHGVRNNVCPPMGFRDENAFDKNKLPHVKKKIPPTEAPNLSLVTLHLLVILILLIAETIVMK